MRLICTISIEDKNENPYAFSYFLTAQKISNQVEEIEGPPPAYRIWVEDEDNFEKALQYYTQYHHDPENPFFHVHDVEATKKEEKALLEEATSNPLKNPKKTSRFLSPAPYGRITTILLFLAIALFVTALFQKGIRNAPRIPGVEQAPLLPSSYRALLFDYPHYFELRDEFLTLYTPGENEKLSSDAQKIYLQLLHTPFWSGLYDKIVLRLKHPEQAISFSGPFFEKIRQGEVWRAFTPALLHFDLLHIFFNLLWFILLGNQIEYRIKSFRYILLILVTAVASNLGQYLMSGSFFMGLSGVVCGLAAFIWARQQVAPWEGYLLNKMTLAFLGLFVIGIFLLQVVFFFIQIFSTLDLNIPIANTAHIVGGIFGYLLGRLRVFGLKHKN